MFKRIGRSLALQFTGFVFLLFIINGTVFLAVDFNNTRRQINFRMLRQSDMILGRITQSLREEDVISPPPPTRGDFRVVDVRGKTVFGDGILSGLPFTSTKGFSEVVIQNDKYDLLTTPIFSGSQLRGYLQLAEAERAEVTDLPPRVINYLAVSILVTVLTYLFGLFFAKRSLKPAEEMFERLDQFTQDASHELRTPLAVLGSSLDVALKTKNYHEGIISAKDDLKQISQLVERLLELARLDKFALQAKPFDLSILVNETADKFRLLGREKSIKIETDVKNDVQVNGDMFLFKQVINNLLSNALKFNHPDGTVKVKLTSNELIIADTGIGISQQDIVHIFNRFYQADTVRNKQGFGLGLALAKRIVELHGWAISVKSIPKKGTTFTIAFRRIDK
jgi:signal transduction histidine kinase